MSPRINRLLIFAVAAAAVGPQSCATIISGRHQTIRVTTIPPGATVTVKGRTRPVPGVPDSYQAPAKLALHRKEKDVTLCVEKDGYRSAEVRLQRGVNGRTFLSLVWLGPFTVADASIGARVAAGLTYAFGFILLDLATGSANALRPGKVEVHLQPSGSSAPSGDAKPLSAWRICGQP